MGRGLHEGDGVQDVVNVVAEVKDGVGDDRLGGSDACGQQRQRGGQRERRLQLLYRQLLHSKNTRGLKHTEESLLGNTSYSTLLAISIR